MLLRQFRAAAQKKFFQAIENLPEVMQENWFSRLLDNNIIPTLISIGYDESFARALFQMAAHSWQRMGPLSDKCIWFHPVLIRNIREIRNEIISKAWRRPDNFSHATVTSIRDDHKIAKNYSGPNASSATCEAPASSWIILPRVYQFLEQQHARYLLGYLKFFQEETHVAFRKILARIIIEFIGNYTYKYRSHSFATCRIDSALFYGYTAMFWNNLIHPPAGFEDELIFSHCLRWVNLFGNKCSNLRHDMVVSIKKMEAYQQSVMPERDAFHPTDCSIPDLGRFLVTLRHGHPGMDAVIDYIGMWLSSSAEKKADRIRLALMPAALNGLFNAIKTRLPAETPAVQNLMRTFVRRLRDNIASKRVGNPGNSDYLAEQRRFVLHRVLGLIDEIAGSWA
ncbi:MAG: hypothetical protein JSW26_29055 [Desulfobacterales bacterium]|nr:MAG: hypothetical protein JSW26_29055 [Desulfobacterales bacterium]